MDRFQILVGFPRMSGTVFKVSIQDRKTREKGWHEYVPAETLKEAEEKTENALRELAKEHPFYQNYKPVVESFFIPLFDGGEGPAHWRNYGFWGTIPDEYVAGCEGLGINLHIFKIGQYRNCNNCEKSRVCVEVAHTAGEQSEG